MTDKKALIIASRGSKLALIQTKMLATRLEKIKCSSTINVIKTFGDQNTTQPLYEIGGKGVFIKELEDTLLKEKANIAVHSLKDLAAQTLPPFKLACFLPRTHYRDVLLIRTHYLAKQGIASLPNILRQKHIKTLGPALIGTGSLRRASFLKEASCQLQIAPIRGNVDTRIAKLLKGEFDAIVLSEAATQRLHIISNSDFQLHLLDPQWFIPSAGQGTVVAETLAKHKQLNQLLATISCQETKRLAQIERGILARLGGSCLLPIGVNAYYAENKVTCNIALFGKSTESLTESITAPQTISTTEIIEQLIEKLDHKHLNQILSSLGLNPINQ